MKKRIISALFAVILTLSAVAPCYAVEARASRYFDGYVIGMTPKGNGQMTVSSSVLGTGKMDKSGAYYIRIEEEYATDKWFSVFTAYGDKDPDTFYSYNAYDHGGDYTFTGMPGAKYRAVMKAYASNSEGYEYSGEIYGGGKFCK